MKKVKSKVSLSIYNCLSYALPNVREYKTAHPDWRQNNAVIYLNNYRVKGPKDYRHSYIFDTERSGVNPISTREILRALEIPQEIIDQIEFED